MTHKVTSISFDSKLNPDQIINQSVWTFARFLPNSKVFKEEEKPNTYQSFLVPILRNLAIIHKPSSLLSAGISFWLAYYVLHGKHTQAKDTNFNKQSQLPLHESVGRAVMFWKKTAPIIMHYKFASFWMNRVKSYDRDRRDEIYDTLHERYALQAKTVACEMKGM